MSNTILIVAGLGVLCAGLVAAAVTWLRGGGGDGDMGTVSPTWIAELRAGDPYDSSR
jgi:hypothetical protein